MPSDHSGIFAAWKCSRQQLNKLLAPSIADGVLKDPQFRLNNGRYKTQLIVTSLAMHVLSLALPIMTLQVYDRILVNQTVSTLHVLVAGVTIAVILESILRLSRTYVINWTSAASEHAITSNSLRHILSTNLSALESEGVSEQMQRMNQVSKLREFTSGQALITLIDLPFVGIYIGLIAYLAGPLAFVPLTILGMFAVVAWYLGVKIKAALINRELADESRFGFIIESLTGIHTIKSLGLENRFQRNYEQLQKKSSTCSYKVAKISSLAQSYGTTFTQLMTVAVITVGAPMAVNGQLTLGSLIACILLSSRIMSPLQKALGIWTRFQDFQIAKNNVKATFELPTTQTIDAEQIGEKLGSVNIDNMHFGYTIDEPAILRNVNLQLKLGECIAISGEHSCGKSTLMKLIAGLYQPTAGGVKINGTAAYQIPPETMIHHVGYLPMEGAIFKGTIRDNLTAFNTIASRSVQEIIRLLGIEKEIAKLPLGFDTPLEGVAADPVPPGLKQRITIARVLSSKPRIILFDDADRALDKDGYHQVYRLLAKLRGKATMIIATDDRNIMQLASKEYVLDKGLLNEKWAIDSSKAHDVQPYKALRL